MQVVSFCELLNATELKMKLLLSHVVLIVFTLGHSTAAQECVDGEVRDQLEYRSASDDYAGEVHYCLNGRWATVCDTSRSWTTNEAIVACRQLGYSDTGAGAGSEVSCAGTDSFVSINCDAREEGLRSCNVKEITASGGTARVACRPGCDNDGALRLVGGSTDRKGRVEVCMNRRWGTVCNNSQEGIAGAVCSQLGFSRINAVRSTTVSVRVGPVYQCTVDDSAIECTITSNSQCDHSNALTVSCLTHENAADDLLNNIVMKCNEELNSTLRERTQQLSSISALQAFLAIAVLSLIGVASGWMVMCFVLRDHLLHQFKKRCRGDSKDSDTEAVASEDRESVNNEFYEKKEHSEEDAQATSQSCAELVETYTEMALTPVTQDCERRRVTVKQESLNKDEHPTCQELEVPSECQAKGTSQKTYTVVALELKRKHRQEKQKRQVSGSAHRREGESSHRTETPSEGRPHPVKPPKYTGTYTRDKASDRKGQEDTECAHTQGKLGVCSC